MAEVAQAIDEFQKMAVRSFGPKDAIELGAVVEMEGNGERSFYLIGPRAGGTEIQHDKKTIMVLTPQSPMGEKLIGRKQGDQVEMQFGPVSERYRVISVE